MTEPSLLSSVWERTKHYGPAVIAVGLMYEGISQFLSVFNRLVAGALILGINAFIEQALRDRIPLANYYYPGTPWQHRVITVAEAVIVLVLGVFFGLWANARSQSQRSL